MADYEEHTLRALRHVFYRGREEGAKAYFFAGDVYEKTMVRRETVQRFLDLCAEAAPGRVFLIGGNHDDFSSYVVYDWVDVPENVHVFRDAWGRVYLPEEDLAIYGRSWVRPSEETFELPQFGEEKRRILLAHGTVGGRDYLPLSPQALQSFEYAALGHIHTPHLERNWAYPGCLVPHSFRHAAPRGFIRGRIEGGRVHLSFQPVTSLAFRELVWDTGKGIDGLLRELERPEELALHLILQGEKLPVAEMRGLKRLLRERTFLLRLEDETRETFEERDVAQMGGGRLLETMLRLLETREDLEDVPTLREHLMNLWREAEDVHQRH